MPFDADAMRQEVERLAEEARRLEETRLKLSKKGDPSTISDETQPNDSTEVLQNGGRTCKRRRRSRSAPFRKTMTTTGSDDDEEATVRPLLREMQQLSRQQQQQQSMQYDWFTQQMGAVSAQVATLAQQLRGEVVMGTDPSMMGGMGTGSNLLNAESMMAFNARSTILGMDDRVSEKMTKTPSVVLPQTPMPTPACNKNAAIALPPKSVESSPGLAPSEAAPPIPTSLDAKTQQPSKPQGGEVVKVATGAKKPAVPGPTDEEDPHAPPSREWQLYPPGSHCLRINRKCIAESKKIIPYEATLERQGSVMIAITMYNEPFDQLQETMVGAMRNLTKWEKTYGKRIQNQIVLLIIADGRTKMDPNTKKSLSEFGFINGEYLDTPSSEDTLHCFYTRALYTHAHSQYGPVHCMVVIKEKNGGKLDSHKIFFDGLCARVRPEYVILLDCGTIPQKQALYKLYDAMEHNEMIGGCAGEIEAQRNWFSPVVTGQAFEYKIAHILDKSAEHVLGFISVLPGAFSAYRYKALTEPDGDSGESPLNKYFAGLHSQNLGPFMSNIFLAEDRILCFELMARHGTSYVLAYVPGAIATCDVPQNTADLLKQRALFALFYCFMNAKQFYTSGLSYAKKASITLEMTILTVLTMLNLLGPGTYYVIFRMVVVSVLTDRSEQVGVAPSVGARMANVLDYSFMFVLLIQLIFGLGNSQPTHIRAFYGATLLYFSFFQIILVGFGIFFVVYANEWLIWMAFGVLFGLYPLAAFIHSPSDTWKVICALPFYLLLVPLFIIVLPIRAFANIHDISWGTKGLESSTVESRQEGFQRFRSVFLLAWVTLNLLFAGVILQLHSSYGGFADNFLRGLFYLAGGINLFRTLCLIALKSSTLICRGSTSNRRLARKAPDREADAPRAVSRAVARSIAQSSSVFGDGSSIGDGLSECRATIGGFSSSVNSSNNQLKASLGTIHRSSSRHHHSPGASSSASGSGASYSGSGVGSSRGSSSGSGTARGSPGSATSLSGASSSSKSS